MRYLEYLQIPYQHEGRGFEGVDCFGMLLLFYAKELGVELKDFRGYTQGWWRDSNYMLDLYEEWGFERCDRPEKNGVILFRCPLGAKHIGIIIDDEHFLHMTLKGAGIAPYITGVWQRKVHSFYRYTHAD